ncbi:MAG: division/cell wall cluster transcriptional repressor MraZ [Ktedonobacterales bacterium]
MFLGEYLHSLDSKGRIAIPARFRSKIERGAVLTRGIDACLYIYPMEIWEQKARELDAADINPRQRRLIERRFFGMALEVELDSQGRIVIPARFRQYAGLGSEATVIGTRDRFEIWSTANWQAYTDEVAAEDLSGLPLPF